MKEIWKFISNTNNEYIVSNFGNVMSLPKIRGSGIGTKSWLDNGIKLKAIENNHGYLYVYIRKYGKKKKEYIHRLVATEFIPNPYEKPFINHLDCNPKNNFIKNLEWCTPKENYDYMAKLGRNQRTEKWLQNLKNAQMKYAKPVKGTSIITGEIRIYKYLNEVKKDGFRPGDVCKCCKGERKTAGKFYWEYIGE